MSYNKKMNDLNNLKQKFLAKLDGKDNKKTIENLIVFVIILIVTIIFINYIWNGDKKQIDNVNKEVYQSETQLNVENIENNNVNGSTDLESELESILLKLEGVEAVSVLITYAESNKIIPMYNEDVQESVTEEEDNQGGMRTINETSSKREVVYEESNGQKNVVTSRVITPEIRGAVVIAKGASNTNVKSNIIQAVEVATGLATHRIQVFEMK